MLRLRPHQQAFLAQRSWARVLAGLGFCGLSWGLQLPLLQLLLLFAALVLIPLALPLTVVSNRRFGLTLSDQVAHALWPIAAGTLMLSLQWPAGPVAGAWACGWLVYTLWLGLTGLQRFLPHGIQPLEELAIDAALVMLPVGGIWLLASRLGIPLLGFEEPWVLLTAIHFHYAGFVLPLVCGITGRWLCQQEQVGPLYQAVTLGALAGVPLLALGIATLPLLEVLAACVVAASVTGLAILFLFKLLPQVEKWSQRLLLVCASLSVVVSMALAVVYAMGTWLGHVWLTIPTMYQTHGILNALGFAFPALLLCRWLEPPARVPAPGIPFSRLKGKGWIGPNFLNLPPDAVPLADVPTGLIDDFSDYHREDFEPDALDPAIRHFYEHTQDYQLFVEPLWQPGFGWGGKLYRKLAETWGQMVLPLVTERRYEEIDSRIIPVDSRCDGRLYVRGWVRTYRETQMPVYVAAYSWHLHQEQVYMNIAFPLPGGNLTSVLYLAEVPVPGSETTALRLSSLPEVYFGDQGVYAVHYPWAMRLPLNETITVWAAGMMGFPELNPPQDLADAPLLATHDMWFLGLHFLTLHYYIYKKSL